MSTRKQREKLREARMAFDRQVAENRNFVLAEEPVEEKPETKKRGRPKKKVE